MFSNFKWPSFSALKLRNGGSVSSLQEWRIHLLDGVLGGIFILWLAALVGGINNVIVEYQDSGALFSNSRFLALLTISVYITSTALFAFITFNRKLKFKLRAGLLIFTLYALGTIGMLLTSFSGDGRILLFAFVIFAGIFFDLRSSLAAFFITVFTLFVIGYLQVSGILTVPPEWQVNAALPGAWISGGIILIFLSIAALVSITYLLQALEGSLVEIRKALQREQHLSQILRTISEVNQLTTRVKDRESLLKGTCELLISDRGYAFAWVGLMASDGVTLQFGSSAGDPVDESKFNFQLGEAGSSPACVEVAIRMKKSIHIEPSDTEDPCVACPRRLKYPNRSAVSLPLLHNDRILGALVVDYDNPTTVFDEQEIALLQELADNLAYALDNIEASTRLNAYANHQKFLNEVTQTALSVLDLDTLLKEFVRKLEEALNADGYYFVLWNGTSQSPEKFVSSDNLREALKKFPPLQPSDRAFSRSILDEGRVLAIPNVMDTPYISPHLASVFNAHSALGLPLIANDQRLGALIFGYKNPHTFTPEELELAEQASRQFALAILKVKLNEETRLKATELERLYASAQDMASSLLDSSALLEKLARHLTEALNVTSTNITSINMATQSMRVVAEYWSDEAAPAEVHSDLGQEYSNSDYETILKHMIIGQVVIIHEDDIELTPVEREQFVEYQIKSMMFVPIMSRGQILGTVEIWESRKQREFSEAEIRLAQAMTSHAGSILENAQLYEKLEQREAYFRALIENSAEGIAIIDSQGIVTYMVPSKEIDIGYKIEDLIGYSAFKNMHPNDVEVAQRLFSESLEHPNRIVSFEYRIQQKDGDWSHYEATGHNMLHDPNVHGIVVNYRNVTRRKQAEQALKESQDQLFSIITTAPNGIIVIDSWSRIVLMNPAAERIFICSAAKMIGQNLEVLMPERFRASHHHVQDFGLHGISNRKIGRHETLYGQRTNGEEFPMEAFISKYEMNGGNFYSVTMQDITERKQDEDNLARRAEELQTLAFVSSALRVASNVSEMIPLIVRHAVEIVTGDYGTIYLLDETTNTLTSSGWYSVERGEDIKITGEPLLRHTFEKGITGYVARTGEMYITEDLQLDPLASILPDEAETLHNAHSGISLPLLSREKVIGVLHVRLKSNRYFTETETRLLTAIAEIAGNALHRATLYEQTLQQADELSHAYDNTLSGWARALEMRDELTEGHTRRVTELTLKLARAMNVSESDIIQIRRGAILHDIGKMGIPDSILNKAGPLSAHEQRIMRMHPQYAHEMLSFIPFLQSALDIPYCHHEWWNGNGYPRGLKGEEIPLSARIFCIVDVWDALTSDRPYRSAWSPERTLKYIQDGSGKQFDPHVVNAFLRLLETH